MQDFDVIDSILQGSPKNFELLVNKYQSNVFRLCIGFLHNRQDAEETTQDVFLKLYRSLSSFKKRSAFATWLYRLTVNSCLNSLKQKKRQLLWTSLSSIFQLSSKETSAEARMIEKSENELIKRAIDALPQKQRLAFILTKYQDLPQSEVATIMNVSEGSVEQLVLRAKKNLKKNLQLAIGSDKVLLSKNQTTS